MKILFIMILLLSYFLFAGSPANFDSFLYRSLWESGHFILFAGIVLALLRIDKFSFQPLYLKLINVTVFCLALGFLTEYIQLLIGRSFQYSDVFNDLVGGYAGLILSLSIGRLKQLRSDKNHDKSFYLANSLLILSLIVLTTIGMRSFLLSAWHQVNINLAFPVLADFEVFQERKRWSSNHSKLSIEENIVRSGSSSLKVELKPARYPGITLNRFESNWTGFKKLNFSIYNPTKENIKLAIKIHDIDHIYYGYQYSDRFNKNFELNPDWNDISISIDEIKNSPKNRKMNIKKIYLVQFFMIDLEDKTIFYIDDIFLSK